jgi:hypothetical protein
VAILYLMLVKSGSIDYWIVFVSHTRGFGNMMTSAVFKFTKLCLFVMFSSTLCSVDGEREMVDKTYTNGSNTIRETYNASGALIGRLSKTKLENRTVQSK